MKRTRHPYRPTPTRDGFTLVELLVVITIIGAIAALSIPAITYVLKVASKNAQKAELTTIESGIDSYYTKHNDYPPDFSDWNIVRRHYLKIFPDIATTELTLLFRMLDNIPDNDPTNATTNGTYVASQMNRAEALVWSLGGFSSDPQFPFTGSGGPLVILDPTGSVVDPGNYEYNPTRNAPEIEFAPERLTFTPPPNPGGTRNFANRTQSTDDSGTAPFDMVDVFPTYALKEGASPVVYFDSRTYVFNAGTAAAPAYNGFLRQTSESLTGWDGIRPIYSTNPNKPPVTGSGTYETIDAALAGWQFVNPNSYQLLSPGLDGLYGEVVDTDPSNDPTSDFPVYYHMSGNAVQPDTTATAPAGLFRSDITRFDVTGAFGGALRRSTNPFRDNMASFMGGTFEEQLP